MKTVFIYALNDPTRPHLGKTRYIGKAVDPYARYEYHVTKGLKEKNYKCNWIKSLLAVGQNPVLEILDEVPETEWQFWEKEWIRLYRALGFRLTNATEGGDGVVPTEELREKLRIAHSNISLETRAKMRASQLGKKHSEAQLEKMRLRMSGERHPFFGTHRSDETCKKISRSLMGRILSEETRKKMSVARTGEKHNFFGKPRSVETRAKISAALKGRPIPPEVLAKRHKK